MTAQLTILLKQELLTELKRAAEREECSVSMIVRRTLRQHFPTPTQPARLLEEAHDVG